MVPVVAHASSDPVSPSSPSTALPSGEQRYIVKYDNNANSEAESQSLTQKGIEVKETLSHAMKASVVVATPTEIESVKKSNTVTSVIPDTKVSVTGATSNWDLDRIDQRTGRDGQYNVGAEGAGVDIYIVDTGINFSHTEFTGRITDSFFNINDGHGANDCNGHGTHVSGTAAGTTYGVAKAANIIPVRVLECDGSGWSSTVMAGIDWAIARHVAGQPAVMNMSIGGFTNSEFDQTVQAAINDGITVVAAAGNDGADACNSSPARVPDAITVAATDINDNQASWSNYGSCVDVQAPGVSIRSAWNNSPTGYNTLSGTSMATPHVTGTAAIMLSRDHSLTPAAVQQSVISNSTYGVVGANKGATPNNFLFVPATPNLPSCSNLKLGDAWAGVGTHCKMQGTSTLSTGGSTTSGTATPALTTTESPVTGASQDASSAPALAPVSAPAPEVAPPAVDPAQQESVPSQQTPVSANNAEKASAAPVGQAVKIEASDATLSITTKPENAAAPAGSVTAASSQIAAPAGHSSVPMESAASTGSVGSDSGSIWIIGTLIALIAVVATAFFVRHLKAPKNP